MIEEIGLLEGALPLVRAKIKVIRKQSQKSCAPGTRGRAAGTLSGGEALRFDDDFEAGQEKTEVRRPSRDPPGALRPTEISRKSHRTPVRGCPTHDKGEQGRQQRDRPELS